MAKVEIKNPANQRRALKRYLTRYHRAKEHQAILQSRLGKLRRDLRERGTASASEIARVEARINQEAEQTGRMILEIMDVIGLLPADSIERTILELRHIDCKPWTEIQRTVHFTRTPCYAYYNKGLDKLLEYPEVHTRIAVYL